VDRLTVRGAMTAEEMLLMLKPAEPRPAQAAGAARDARDAAAGPDAGRSATSASGPARRSVSFAAGVGLIAAFVL